MLLLLFWNRWNCLQEHFLVLRLFLRYVTVGRCYQIFEIKYIKILGWKKKKNIDTLYFIVRRHYVYNLYRMYLYARTVVLLSVGRKTKANGIAAWSIIITGIRSFSEKTGEEGIEKEKKKLRRRSIFYFHFLCINCLWIIFKWLFLGSWRVIYRCARTQRRYDNRVKARPHQVRSFQLNIVKRTV